MTAENMYFARLFSGFPYCPPLSQSLSPGLTMVEQVTLDQIPSSVTASLGLEIQVVLFSCKVLSDSLRTHCLQYAGTSPSPSPSFLTPKSTDSVMSSNHLILCLAFSMIQRTLAIWLWKKQITNSFNQKIIVFLFQILYSILDNLRPFQALSMEELISR